MWCHVLSKQFGWHTCLLFSRSRYETARAGKMLRGGHKGKFSSSTNFPNYVMAVSEVSFTLRLETDLGSFEPCKTLCVRGAGSAVSTFLPLSLNVFILDFQS